MQKMQGSHSFEKVLLCQSIGITVVSISMYLETGANIAIFQQAARGNSSGPKFVDRRRY